MMESNDIQRWILRTGATLGEVAAADVGLEAAELADVVYKAAALVDKTAVMATASAPRPSKHSKWVRQQS